MRAIEHCRELAQFTEEPGHITRTFLSPPMRGVHELVGRWMREAGCEVAVDAVGNIRGVYPAARPNAPRLVIGSHLDTVPHAGAFDGILGVTLALELVAALNGRRLHSEIEIVGFSEEEGVRFGTPFIGSRAAVGSLDDDLLHRIAPAVCDFGLDPAAIPDAAWQENVRAYLEFHIEQGPVLESLDLPLGIVTAIAGQTRAEVEFQGHANHAGTTPMHLRHDALAAAAEWILAVEDTARKTEGLVATVGKVCVDPGAANVIPGHVSAVADVRHADDAVRHNAVARILEAASRRVPCTTRILHDQSAVPMDTQLVAMLEHAVCVSGFPVHRMTSGAGHDAMIVARRFPAAMLFLRSPGGISHHPDESVLAGDVTAALAAGAAFLEQWSAHV